MNRAIDVRILCLGSLLFAATYFSMAYVRAAIVYASAVNLSMADLDQLSQTAFKHNRKSVLVELITSSECRTCQAAEGILTHLDRDQPMKDTDIIVLHEQIHPPDPSEPSGYLSPTDPTRRQENYQNLGTASQPVPLFLVNGEVLGEHTSTSEVEESVRTAQMPVVPLTLMSVQVRGDTVLFSLENGPSTEGYVNVYAAVVDPAPSSGMHSDQQTQRSMVNSSLVETFGRVGSSFRTKALGRGSFILQSHVPDAAVKLNGSRLVVFVQTKHRGLVLGSTSCVLRRDAPLAGILPQASFPNNVCPFLRDNR